MRVSLKKLLLHCSKDIRAVYSFVTLLATNLRKAIKICCITCSWFPALIFWTATMNYSSLNSVKNACFKVDRGFRQKLLQNWCKNQRFQKPKLSFSSDFRNFCSSDCIAQSHKDDITVLPSPQEVSKTNTSVFLFRSIKYRKAY